MTSDEGNQRTDPATESERGATASEYAVLIGFFALVIIAGVTIFGAWLNGYYGDMAQELRAVLR